MSLLFTQEGLNIVRPLMVGGANAVSGMLGEIEAGDRGRDDPVIFLHTGGLPALFAFSGERR